LCPRDRGNGPRRRTPRKIPHDGHPRHAVGYRRTPARQTRQFRRICGGARGTVQARVFAAPLFRGAITMRSRAPDLPAAGPGAVMPRVTEPALRLVFVLFILVSSVQTLIGSLAHPAIAALATAEIAAVLAFA